MTRSQRVEWALAIALLGLFYVRVVASARAHSITADEFAHLPAGMRNLARADYQVFGTTPPLGRVPAALAALAMGVAVPARAEHEHEWDVGYRFEAEQRERYLEIFARARLAAALVGLLLAAFVWRWSRRVWGERGGLFSLALCVLEPNLIGHSGLIGTDVMLALSAAATLAALARLGRRGDGRAAAVAGMALGAALLSKHTAFLLLPVLVVSALRRCAGVRSALLAIGVAAAVALFVLNAGYRFQGTLQPLSSYHLVSRELRRVPPVALPALVPAAWLEGVDRELAVIGQGFPCFLNGRFYPRGGPWYYDLQGLALKTPLAELALLLAVALLSCLRSEPAAATRPALAAPGLEVAVFAALLLLSASISRLDEGVRYLLCLYPLLAYACGGLAARLPRLAPALLAVLAVESATAWPDELAFFNRLASGWGGALDLIGGSNLDLCQDLPALSRELAARGIDRPGLACLGRVDPRLYGISYRLARPPFEPGWYAISAAYLQGARYVLRDPGTNLIEWSEYGDFRPFRALTPVARVGPAIYLYHLDRPLDR